MKYLKKFREFRKQQVDQIHNTQSQLKHKIVELNDEKAQKDRLRTTEEQQKQELMKETDNTNKVIEDLKGQESQLLKNIEKNRVIAKRVNNAIQVVIEREMKKAQQAAEEEEKKRLAEANKTVPAPPAATDKPAKPGTTTPVAVNNPPAVVPRPRTPRGDAPELFLTPTDVALANNFEGNRGKLYWPVEKGYITDHYGTHPHPVERKVMINNTGVDIQTSSNAVVKAVFEGKVSSVLDLAGVKMVMLTHGNYFTVYNNLLSASVKIGDHVNTNQAIGIVAVNEEGEPTIKFQIWKSAGTKKGSVSLNPEQWLGKPR
jgi:septal ring factor EnvC (AmiA/AmiB activator)